MEFGETIPVYKIGKRYRRVVRDLISLFMHLSSVTLGPTVAVAVGTHP